MTVPGQIVLEGCRTQPLASYLKALGVLRLVAAQADRAATGCWQDDRFVLHAKLTADELTDFFVSAYVPSPILSPWNGGSGFYPKDNRDGITPIEASVDPRLAVYREAIAVGRMLAPAAIPQKQEKADLLSRCRAQLPDGAVAWMDAAVVLLGEGPAFPPLLGSGGNDGRLDFSNNFMQRLLLLLGIGKLPKGASPAQWFRSALFGTPSAGVKAAIGQFDPGAAGGPNSAALGAADSTVNPADFVLLVEGSLLIAAGAARRLGSSTKRAAMPFTFESSSVGYPSAAEEEGRGELWLPLWRSPTTAPEISRLFAEGRCAWKGGQARSGLDAARAAVTLGVDRGIDRFTRFALLTRNGLATAAVPVGTIVVAERDDVRVLADLDGWLDRIRRAKNRPNAVTSGVRFVEAAMFKAATREGATFLLDVLSASARLDAVVATATAFHTQANVLPLNLSGSKWVSVIEAAALGSAGVEVRLAACFASLMDGGAGPYDSLRLLLRPIRPDGRYLAWTASPIVLGFGRRLVTEVLAEAHTRRFMVVDELPSQPGAVSGASAAFFGRGLWANLEDVRALLAGEIDVDRFQRLLAGLLLLDWTDCKPRFQVTGLGDDESMPPLYSVVAPFFGSPPLLSVAGLATKTPGTDGGGSRIGVPLIPGHTWAALLGRDTSGALDTVVGAALLRLRIARWQAAVTADGIQAAPLASRALSAALLLRLHPSDRRRLLDRVAVRTPEPA